MTAHASPAMIPWGCVLVLDTTLPLHTHRAGLNDRLGSALRRLPISLVITDVVAYELGNHSVPVPPWLQVVALEDLIASTDWGRIVGSQGRHHAGEASTLAQAQAERGIAIIDDRDALRAARNARNCPTIHGSPWLLCALVNHQVIAEITVSQICDRMLETGIRWPFPKGGFVEWCRVEGLLKEEY